MKFQVASILICLCVSSSLALVVKRDTGHVAWKKGVEYVYNFNSMISAGSKDYTSFASVFNISATVKIQGGDTINAKFENIKYGAFNGKFESYSPASEYTLKEYEELKPLSEPFQVQLQDGKVKGIVLNGNIPEWAQNIQRGLASILQLDINHINDEEASTFTTTEKTTNGNCPTDYTVIPSDTVDNMVEVRKYKSISQCTEAPFRMRMPGIVAYPCKDKATRDAYNGTAFGTYKMESKGENWVVKSIMSYSAVVVGIFGTKGHTQYAFQNTHMELVKTNEGGFEKFAPANSESHEDIAYVFEEEQRDENEDLTKPSPFFFHYADVETDHATQMKTQEQLYAAISKLTESMNAIGVYKDTKEFHKSSPFAVIPLISGLDFEHVKQCYEKYLSKKDTDKFEYQIFLDALVVAGTGPTSLMIRDIVKATDDTAIIARLVGPFANYVRNPTEKLIKEFEPLLKAGKQDSIKAKVNGRLIDFAFGSLINRACQKSACSKSGVLDKYTKYYIDRYNTAESFEEKTAAVNVLRNIGLEAALTKLVEIVSDENQEKSVRVAAIGGLKGLGKFNPTLLKQKLVPIFFNRTEDSELRSVAGLIYAISTEDSNVMNEMVIYMWTEKDPNVKNYLKSFLEGIAYSTRPCIKSKGSFAMTALRMFPPWEIKPTYSSNMISDYYDPDYHFGQMNHIAIHKNGDSVLPSSIYMGLNGAIGGYGMSYLGIYIRMEGFGKMVINKLMDMATGNIMADDIKEVFEKIGVEERQETPMKLEFGLMLHNRIITYHAVDSKALKNIPALVQKLSEMKSQADTQFDISRMLMLGGVLHQTPLEIGIPVSMIGSVTAVAGLNYKSTGGKTGQAISKESTIRFQFHVFGITSLSTHMPALRTMHSVTAYRTLRYRVPRHISIGVDVKQQSLNFAVNIPTEEDPIVGMVHATSTVNIQTDYPARHHDQEAVAILSKSCPTCNPREIISKGEEHRGTRRLGAIYKYYDMEGVKAGGKYFDCEREHTRSHVFKQLKKFWGPENKNHGKRPTARFFLGLQYMRDYLFFSPTTQTCGMKVFYLQDKTASSILDKIEGQIRMKFTSDQDKKIGSKVLLKSSFNLNYIGAEPKRKTLDVVTNLQTWGNEKREVKVKAVCRDEKKGTAHIACLEVEAEAKRPTDYFSFEGENDPTYERKITLVWDKADGKDPQCPNSASSPGIRITRKSQRSPRQIEEAKSDNWPYKQCRAQKNSPKYPGKLTPATQECVWSAFKQTALKQSNITLDYKVELAARKRWRVPIAIATTILAPYMTDEDTAETHVEKKGDGKFAEGQIKIDVNAGDEPTMDIHWHGSEGQDEHFHGVDTSWLPGPLKGRTIHSRFSPLYYQAFMMGLYSYCDVTPAAVQTYDNLTYFGDMSECQTLVSADCTKKPRYAILSNKIASDKIAIVAYLGEHKIELDNLNNAKVDGKDVPLTDEFWTPDDEDKLFKIVKMDPNNVFLLSYKLGVFVRYTGHYTTVTLGSRYRSTQCGLCGDFNGCKYNDLTGPDGKCTNLGPNDMMKAYVVRDGNCKSVGSACPKN